MLRDIYKELIEINTTDSIGDTTKAAEAMAVRFRAAGFPEADVRVMIHPENKRKGNLVVRYRSANASRKPILLLAHIDVVEARKEDWSDNLDPFKLTERDGYFYGRGTADDKAMAAIFVANLIDYKQKNAQFDRDIILALTADEEGGDFNGPVYLLKNHRELLNAELDEQEGTCDKPTQAGLFFCNIISVLTFGFGSYMLYSSSTELFSEYFRLIISVSSSFRKFVNQDYL